MKQEQEVVKGEVGTWTVPEVEHEALPVLLQLLLVLLLLDLLQEMLRSLSGPHSHGLRERSSRKIKPTETFRCWGPRNDNVDQSHGI